MSDHVLGRSVTLKIFARTVALFRVSDDEAARLAAMPSAVLRLPGEYYLLPPIRYPDGRAYLKLGGDPDDVVLADADAIGDWFRSGGNPAVRDHLEGVMRAIMPDLAIEAVEMDACVTTWTADGRPEIGSLSPRLAVATAGCGAGAKCSDELGRRGASALLQNVSERIAS
jgi:sarcosine oxidase